MNARPCAYGIAFTRPDLVSPSPPRTPNIRRKEVFPRSFPKIPPPFNDFGRFFVRRPSCTLHAQTRRRHSIARIAETIARPVAHVFVRALTRVSDKRRRNIFDSFVVPSEKQKPNRRKTKLNATNAGYDSGDVHPAAHYDRRYPIIYFGRNRNSPTCHLDGTSRRRRSNAAISINPDVDFSKRITGINVPGTAPVVKYLTYDPY